MSSAHDLAGANSIGGETMGRFEILTNIVDALAFLLVTVDLYGPERLEALHQRLIKVKLQPFDPFALRETVILYKEPSRKSGWREVALLVGVVGVTMFGLFAVFALVSYVADGLIRGWVHANVTI
jgi:hypothetical protein